MRWIFHSKYKFKDIYLVLFLPLIVLTILFRSPAAAQQQSDLLLTMPAILAGSGHSASPPPVSNSPLTIRVYVAGESVEQFNHFNNSPLNANGSLNNLGPDNNTPDEYGWMVPLAQRLKIRDPNISISWVGSDCWYNQVTWECSDGALTNSNIGHSSAQAGSTVAVWLADHGSELTGKEYCYDVAFASRGGNDLNNGVSVDTYRNQLRTLINDLDQGSSCRTHPVIYVTAHLLDIAGWDYANQQADIDSWMAAQQAYYVTVAQDLVNELNNQNGKIVRFIDMWTPFREDKATTAFPSETWWTVDSGSGVKIPDLDKIHRDGEGQHPKRLASIFAGENVADQINIQELRTLLGH